mmetsp:Transcript_106732/g.184109  ORF Transcript_106732/g.184109 Transcript_106732/m.184109 type:complete len:85 (-) Transcript_106732:948-1202(-)
MKRKTEGVLLALSGASLSLSGSLSSIVLPLQGLLTKSKQNYWCNFTPQHQHCHWRKFVPPQWVQGVRLPPLVLGPTTGLYLMCA